MSCFNATQHLKTEMYSFSNTTQGEFMKTFQYLLHIPTFTLGLIIHSVALWILCFRLKNWTENVIYMTNLIFSDILLLFSLPFKMHAYQTGERWSLGSVFCQFVESLYFVNTYGTILLIMLISLDRYIAIKHPFLARTLRSPKKATIACTVLWLCVWSASIPNYLQEENGKHCFKDFAKFWCPGRIPLSMITVFLVAASVVIFCSAQIIRTLQRVDEERDDVDTKISRKIISSNLVTFLLCFTPYHLALFLYFLVRNSYIAEHYLISLRVLLQICQCFATTNCCLDAMYYHLIIKKFWKSENEQLKRNVLLSIVVSFKNSICL
ncbi:G-protein coupled receptor 55-like [Hypanus sabinus]|uniref:G-protein coupled receptor 55-like n=1 Tax=Hypanus sabinus TaxID=79690 RepID=UPI0028C3DC02|nr:G-protein coupled receptor 55-like [Hypanus sabinus]XP_059804082.1 G-protein coupled receptor 55-like [Hypanus sabinus]